MDTAIATVMRTPAVIQAALAADHETLTIDGILVLTRSLAESRRHLDLYAAKLTVLACRKEAHTAAGKHS